MSTKDRTIEIPKMNFFPLFSVLLKIPIISCGVCVSTCEIKQKKVSAISKQIDISAKKNVKDILKSFRATKKFVEKSKLEFSAIRWKSNQQHSTIHNVYTTLCV